jgi:AcrR family transcriptional regulator
MSKSPGKPRRVPNGRAKSPKAGAATPQSRRNLPAEKRKRELLDAAVELFAMRGTGITVQGLADRVNVTQPLVHRYFPTKADLIRSISRELREAHWDKTWREGLRDRSRPLEERIPDFYRHCGTGIGRSGTWPLTIRASHRPISHVWRRSFLRLLSRKRGSSSGFHRWKPSHAQGVKRSSYGGCTRRPSSTGFVATCTTWMPGPTWRRSFATRRAAICRSFLRLCLRPLRSAVGGAPRGRAKTAAPR